MNDNNGCLLSTSNVKQIQCDVWHKTSTIPICLFPYYFLQVLALKLLQQSLRSRNSAEIKRLVYFGSRHSTRKTWCSFDVCNVGKNLVDSYKL